MDINFPLILVILVFVSGLIALVDKLFLAKRRQADEAESTVVEYSKSFFPVLLLVLVLRSFLVEPFQIPSSSMVPTLEVGDFILVNKFTYGIRLPVVRTQVFDVSDPQRGDVMVFFPAIHRDPNVWEKPNEFDPDLHFSSEAVKNRDPLNYLTFSHGPRSVSSQKLSK